MEKPWRTVNVITRPAMENGKSQLIFIQWIGLRENRSRKPWFLPSNIGLSCKFSHHPILWFMDDFLGLPLYDKTVARSRGHWNDDIIWRLEDWGLALWQNGKLRCGIYMASKSMGEFQDPKLEVLYHIRPYFVVIFPYIGLKHRPYVW